MEIVFRQLWRANSVIELSKLWSLVLSYWSFSSAVPQFACDSSEKVCLRFLSKLRISPFHSLKRWTIPFSFCLERVCLGNARHYDPFRISITCIRLDWVSMNSPTKHSITGRPDEAQYSYQLCEVTYRPLGMKSIDLIHRYLMHLIWFDLSHTLSHTHL